MEAIAKSDIFFFVTTICIVLVTIIIVIAGYYVIQTLRNVREVSRTIKRTVHTAESEMAEIGERITESPLFAFIFGKKKKKKE